MHWDAVQGSWDEVKISVKSRWTKLTDEDLRVANGRLDEMMGVLQRRYGMQREEARRELERFADAVKERALHFRHPSNSPTAD